MEMGLPDRAFVIVVETEGERDPGLMPLLRQRSSAGWRAPAFSSMHLATAFLAGAQELGYYVKLDYIFPADGGRLAEDFPGYEFRLDPGPEEFFAESPSA